VLKQGILIFKMGEFDWGQGCLIFDMLIAGYYIVKLAGVLSLF